MKKPVIVTTDAYQKSREFLSVAMALKQVWDQQNPGVEWVRAAELSAQIDSNHALLHDFKSKVEAALAEVNGRATSHTVTSYGEVTDVIKRAEALLDKRGVAKSNRVGVTVRFTPAGPSAKAYKYAAKSTTITLRRRKGDWVLEGVEATEVYPRSPERLLVGVSPEVANLIRSRAMDSFYVHTLSLHF
jgi:hypothetical protein